MLEFYEIRCRGQLDISWSDWFENMTIAQPAAGITVLTGGLPDQAALHGVLTKLYGLNLTLLSVNRLEQLEAEMTERGEQ